MSGVRTRDTVGKGIYGLLVRAAQGLLLLAGVVEFAPRVQADLATALVLASVANLVTNFGIPTLLVRESVGASTADGSAIGSLVRAYAVLTLAGALVLTPICLVVLASPAMALATVCLLLGTSAVSLLEYSAAGTREYEAFLRGPARLQVVLALLAAPVAYSSGSLVAGLGVLTLSALLPLVFGWGRRRCVQLLRNAVEASEGLGRWWRSASQIALATAGAGILYGADVFVIRGAGLLEQSAQYRLAVAFVGVAVGLVPAGFFVVALASRGDVLVWRGRISLYIIAAGALTTVVGLGASIVLPNELGEVGRLLRWMGPLAAIRVATQIAVGREHGLGRYGRVAVRFWIATVLFISSALVAAGAWGLTGVIAVQIGVELGLVLSFAVARDRPLTVAPPTAARA